MKYSTISASIICATAALLLAGCGGGSATNASIGGTLAGLSGGTSVVLMDNNTDPITVAANGSFTFDQQISSGSTYSVTVSTQPIGETCTVVNGSGTVDQEGDFVTTIVVSCVTTA